MDAEDGRDQPRRGWAGQNPLAATFLGCGCLLLVLIVPMAVFAGLNADWDAMPPTGVVGGGPVEPSVREAVHAIVELAPDEEILWFYSAGLFDYAEDGNLITDRRVVSWTGGDDEPWVSECTWDQIDTIEVLEEGSFFFDAVYNVVDLDGNELELWFAAEEKLHERALAELYQRSGL